MVGIRASYSYFGRRMSSMYTTFPRSCTSSGWSRHTSIFSCMNTFTATSTGELTTVTPMERLELALSVRSRFAMMTGLFARAPRAGLEASRFAMTYCSFGQTKCRILQIKLYGLQSWYIASLCHHNGAAKRNFDESPLSRAYGRARDHGVHHLHHHQHHLGRGPFWVSPICRSISSTVSIALQTRFFSLDKE